MRKMLITPSKQVCLSVIFNATYFLKPANNPFKTFHWLFAVVLLLTTTVGFSQISGTKTVGTGGDYQNLTQAFAAINSNTLNGDIVLQLLATYPDAPETFPVTSPTRTAIGTNNVSIYPTASGLAINGSVATGILSFDNTKNITLDGRVNATGTTTDLVVSNDDVTTGYALQFVNDATNNTIKYCSVRGGSVSTTSGVVKFGSTAATLGNSNNLITNCTIRESSGFPQIAVYSVGNTSVPNQLNTIINCNIANFWNATLASQGINLGAGNTQWTITANSFYQTSTRTAAASVTQTVLLISNTSGNNFTITDNFIGGNAPSAAGSPWTYTNSSTTIGLRLFCMNISLGNTTASTIQNNTIKNITGTTGTTTNPVMAGIIVQNGSFNVGTVTGNTIGSNSGTGSIVLNYSNTAGTLAAPQMFGIWSTASVAASTVNIYNNGLGSITLNGSTTSSALGFEGIIATGGSYTTINVKFNTIGSTATANSINAATVSVAGQQLLRGIDIQSTITSGNINVRVDTNIVANMNQSSTLANTSNTSSGANIRGIVVSPAASNGLVTITGNQVYNISGAGATAPVFSSQGSISGIVMFATSTISTVQIYDNDVHSLYGTNTGAVQYAVAGIVTSNATTANAFRNKIYDLKNASTSASTAYPPIVAGYWYGASGGAYTFANNMITLGDGATGNVIYAGIISYGNSGGSVVPYFNSIRIMGTAASGALPSYGILRTSSMTIAVAYGLGAGGTTFLLRNNLIDNIRNGGTGKHYAIGNISTSGATGWNTTASNFNILNAPSSTAIVGWGTGPAGTDYSLAGFKTLTGGDASSISAVNVNFLAPANGNLHINMGVTGNQIESTGTPVSGFTTDYDNDTRPGPIGSVNGGGTFSDIGADEFDGVILDITPPTIAYTALNNTSLTGGKTLTNFANITDLSGINGAVGMRPRIYFKRSTDANTYNDNTSGTAGWKFAEANGASSPFSFTLDYTKLSGGTGVSMGSIVQYFVVAQDLPNPTPNVAIYSGIFANAQNSVNLTTSAFPILGSINSYNITQDYTGSINVGTSETITSLTNANGLFDKINHGVLTGDLTVNITSDLTAETGVIGLNQFAEDGTGGYTLTIKPTGTARTITGTPSTPSLIKLNGADRVIINGSLTTTGTDRSLTISNMSTDYDLGNISDNCVIHVSSPAANNGATNNTIKNCIIRGLSNLGTEYAIAQGGSDAGGDPGSGALSPNSNNTYQNNLVFASNFGIFLNGSSSNPDLNTTVANNDIGSNNSTLSIYYSGVWSQGESGLKITDNNISGIAGSLSPGFAINGIFINSLSANLVVTGNNITNVKNTSTTGGATGIRLGAFGALSTNMLIANNTISDISARGTNAVPTETNNGSGMIVTSNVSSASAYKIYYNSINLNTNQTGGTAAAFVVAAGVTTAGALDVRNNSFATTQTSHTRYAIYVASNASVFTNINQNDYYAIAGGTLGFLSSARSTLTAWQTATNQDANSLSADPIYKTPTMLKPTIGSPLIGAGTPINGILTDQVKAIRSLSNPSIGAYEMAVCSDNGSAVNESICNGNSYYFHGMNLTVSGTYYDTLVGGNTCGGDSMITLQLTVKPTSSSLTNIAVCTSELPFTWNGLIFTIAGTQTATLTNAQGCDSLATLTLTVIPATTSTNYLSICSSEFPYSWNGLIFATPGSQTANLTNAQGCDSLATLILTAIPSTTSTTNLSICSGELPYSWNGLTFAAAGSQTVILTNAAGCDSTATLILTVIAGTSSTTNLSICLGELPYFWNGLTFTTAGTQTATLTNAAGCDSAATLILTLIPGTTSTTNLSICPGELPYSWNGLTFTSAGSMTATLTNDGGCDSLATLVLTVLSGMTSNTNISICPVELPYSWNGLTFTMAGSQTAYFTSAAGCDSTATLNLIVKSNSASETTVTACNSYFWNDSTYKFSGDYTWLGVNAAGCDSVATLHLTIVSVTGTFTQTDALCFGSLTGSITVTPSGGTAPYTYRLATSGSYTSSNTFSGLRAGNYRVYILDANGCTGTTAIITIAQPSVITATFTKTNATCYGAATGSINVSPTNGVSPYTYRLGTSGAYGTSNTFAALKAGNYTVYILDANGCAGNTSIITILQPSAITSTFTKTDATCYASSTGSITVVPSSGVSPYTYRLGTSGAYVASNTFTALKAGSYTVYILDASGCAGNTSIITIAQPSAISSTFTKTDAICFGSATGSITVVATSGVSPFTYRLGTSGTYGTSSTFTSLKSGNYYVYILDALGCAGTTTPVNIAQPAAITGTFTKTDVTCYGASTGSVTVTPTTGVSPYTFKLGTAGVYGISNTFASLKAGTYVVYMLDANNCLGSLNITIAQSPKVAGNASVTNVSGCYGGSNGSVTITPTVGLAPFTYRLGITGAFVSGNVFSGLKAGNYTFNLQDANGCIGAVSATVSQPTLVGGTISKTNVSCYGGNNGSINITGTGGTPGYQYKFGTSGVYSNTNFFSGLSAGAYNVYVRDANGCIYTTKPTVTQPSSISATFSKTDESCPNAANGSITINGAGGTAPYTYRYGNTGAFTTSNTFTGLKAGSHNIYINDANGCSYLKVIVLGNVSTTCLSAPPIAKLKKPVINESNKGIEVSLSPNPSSNIFNLIVHSQKQQPIAIHIFDVYGKPVHTVRGMPEQTIHFGEALLSGTYMVEVKQGDETKTIKAVKIR